MSQGVFASLEGLQRTVLPNGLTVVSEWIPGVRSVALGAWVRSASIHESPASMGISHMLEHMVFKGTARRSAREIATALESLGGSLDAFTGREHTSFQARVLDEHIDIACDVLGDLMFHPLLREEDLELEKQVVLEEISLVDDTPDDLVFELHNEQMWGGSPFGYSILGTRETVAALSGESLARLHRSAYRPDNVVVGAAGNVSHDRLLESLGAAGWGDLPAKADTSAMSEIAPPVPLTPITRHVRRDTTQTHLVLGSSCIAYSDPRRYALVLVDVLLGGGMSSRLFQRVREQLGLAYSVFTYQSFHRDVGVHGVYAGTSPSKAHLAAEEIRAELLTLMRDGLSAAELAAGKSQLKGQVTLSMESVGSRMFRAAAVELYGEKFRTLDDVLAEIDAISMDVVAELCARYFSPDSQTVLFLGPED